MCFYEGGEGRGQLHIMYEDVLKKLNSQFPFTDFECEMLSFMNVTPVQLHPNSWAFLHIFQILCKSFKIKSIVNKFMCFYQLKKGVKVRRASLNAFKFGKMFQLYN